MNRDERHRRAADHHHVGRAPERHVLAEQPVPHVVEREADQREDAQRRSATPPTGRASPRDAGPPRGRVALGQDDRQQAGGEDAEQPDEDEVVGRVGQRPRVAAVVDVQRDVPVHAEQRQ